MMYLGVDYGKKRIGLALGAFLPKGAGVIENKNSEKSLFDIAKLCEEKEVERIIFGIPMRSDRSEGDLASEIREFAQKLNKITDIPVEYEEEQFTSVEAEKILAENRGQKGYKELKIDELAAVLILEQYIGSK
jgi:putative Holliday junction resolvase